MHLKLRFLTLSIPFCLCLGFHFFANILSRPTQSKMIKPLLDAKNHLTYQWLFVGQKNVYLYFVRLLPWCAPDKLFFCEKSGKAVKSCVGSAESQLKVVDWTNRYGSHQDLLPLVSVWMFTFFGLVFVNTITIKLFIFRLVVCFRSIALFTFFLNYISNDLFLVFICYNQRREEKTK